MSKPDEDLVFPGLMSPGLSLRDYFAGQALTGVFASGSHRRVAEEIGRESQMQDMGLTATALGKLSEARIAEMVYAVADAMLSARAQARTGE